MLALDEHVPNSIYREARKRGIKDATVDELIEEFRKTMWRVPTSFVELLEVLE